MLQGVVVVIGTLALAVVVVVAAGRGSGIARVASLPTSRTEITA